MNAWITTGVYVAGAGTLLIGVGHLTFPRIIGWQPDLERIREVPARIFVTLNLGVSVLLSILGLLTLAYATELAGPSGLARALSGSLAAFWAWRLGWQLYYFRPQKLLTGRGLLALHYGVIGLSALLTLGYAAPLVGAG